MNCISTPVKFVNDMMVDGNDGTQPSSSRPYVMLNARTGGVTSTATLAFSDNSSADYVEGEDVETLFDSNLANVPMVYTVSGDGMAVSINQLPALTVVPFGVTCSSSEPVNIECSMFNAQYSTLHVFDALLGTTTAIGDGETINVQPNDYGRYFLTTSEKMDIKKADMADGIIVSERDGIVTVTSNSRIDKVHVISVNGAAVYEQMNCGTNTQFRLQPGTYVIEAEVKKDKQTLKILVK